MKTRRPWMLVVVLFFGLALAASTSPTVAYSASSRPDPFPQTSVGYLFSNGFTFFGHFHHYYHHAHAGTRKTLRDPADVFDHK
jgi:hypothetical protein